MKFPWRKHQKPAQKDETRLTTEREGIIISVIRKDYRPFYDTTWNVEITASEKGTPMHNLVIVRDDTETATTLEKAIRELNLATMNENQVFNALDCRRKIYYD